MVYDVPGDGACGPNSVSAHLFEDENEGPKLRISMNRFMAEHWDRQYKFLTQCSPESPFIRKCKGRNIKFTDPTELIKGGAAISLSKHFVSAHLGLDLIINQSV